MHALHHVVKIIIHLMINLHHWVETAEVNEAIKDAKEKIQEALKPGKVPGGSPEENLGVAYEFPDAKVLSYFLSTVNPRSIISPILDDYLRLPYVITILNYLIQLFRTIFG